ncbi:MAG: inositol monophosphatase family protein [Candidatus Hermodarchaeota archaeon]
MELDIDFLKNLALTVYNVVHPLLGLKKASEGTETGAGGDISMHIDVIAENSIIHYLEENKIDILLISEEIGEKFIGDKKRAIQNQNILIVDPVDGSNNAVRGIPYCSVSIAYAIGQSIKDIQKGVVLDLVSKDIYWAVKGKGAYLNDLNINVSSLDLSDKCFFELDLPEQTAFKYIDQMKHIIQRFYRTRILGSSALSLCQVARGSMEAFINLKASNRLVDVAAGYLILKEAGGSFFSTEGIEINQGLSINTRFPFIACNQKLESYLKKEFMLIRQEH